MSIPFGKVVEEVQNTVRLFDKDNLDNIKRSANLLYYELCEHESWLPLRRKISIDFTNADANNAMLLPGDLAGIDAVWDDEREYFPSERGRSENDASGADVTYRWFYAEPVADPLAILKNIRMSQGASTFTGGAWDASYIGEYMQIGEEQGFYKLTVTRTFTPRYYGPRLGGAPDSYLQIRPAGTKRFSIVDNEGAFEANTVSVYYWAYPPPLYQAYQSILLPSHKPLELGTIIRVLLNDRKANEADNYRGDFVKALSDMEGKNPKFIASFPPKDRYGEGLRFTRVK